MPADRNKDIREFLSSPLTFDKFKPKFTSTPINTNRALLNKQRNKPIINDNDPKQLVLDCGQKSIGMTYCNDCGMMYSADVKKDTEAHNDYHNRFTDPKSFKVIPSTVDGWKKKSYYEIIVGKTSGILFKVENKPRSQITKKLTSIIEEFVDPQIGICPDVPVFSSTANEQFGFMFITDATLTTKSFVGAVVLAERVLAGKLMPMNKIYKEEYGFIAIERLWVHPLLRREKLATKILDIIKRLYSTDNKLLGRTRVAFTEPNDVCIKFAQNYLDEKYKKRYIIYVPEEMANLNEISLVAKAKSNTVDGKDKDIVVKKENVESKKAEKRKRNDGDNKENDRKATAIGKAYNGPEIKKFRVVKSDESIISPSEPVQELIPTTTIDDEDNSRELELSTELY